MDSGGFFMSRDNGTTSSGQRTERVALAAVHDHPANPNVMSAARLEQLTARIASTGHYPPLIVRPHPEQPCEYQLLDGHQRARVLRQLGHEHVDVVVWVCSDAEASLLLVSLNRLTGEDDPIKRDALLEDLLREAPEFDLDELVTSSEADITDLLETLAVTDEPAWVETTSATSPTPSRRLSFTVSAAEGDAIELAVDSLLISSELRGSRRRGRALALICGLKERADD